MTAAPGINGDLVRREDARAGRFRVFELIPPEQRPDDFRDSWMDRVELVYRSEVYIAQRTGRHLMENGREVVVIALRRCDARDIHETWSELAAILAEIVGDHVWAFEVFPPADRLVNQAPMRWFWVLPDFQEVLPVGLHRKGMVGEEMGDGS